MTQETRKDLLQVIEGIADVDRKRLKIRRERDNILDRTRVIHAQLVLDIASAKDESGKPLYSNEQARQAALTLRWAENEDSQRLTKRQRELYEEDDSLAIEHNRLIDRKELLMLELGLESPASSDSA